MDPRKRAPEPHDRMPSATAMCAAPAREPPLHVGIRDGFERADRVVDTARRPFGRAKSGGSLENQRGFSRESGRIPWRTAVEKHTRIQQDRSGSPEHTLDPTMARRSKAPLVHDKAREGNNGTTSIIDAWGVKTKAAARGPERQTPGMSEGESTRARHAGGSRHGD